MNIPTSSDGKTFDHEHIVFYPYTPSKCAAYIFVALFGVSTVWHAISMFPYRAWFFIPLILGGICETFGYYGRSLSSNDPKSLGPFMMQNLLILSGPLFIAATIYMNLSRLIRHLEADEYALISPRWLSKLYVAADILSFITQFAGAGVQITGDPKIMSMGIKAVVGGLIVHTLLFIFFIFMTWKVQRRLKHAPTTKSRRPDIRLRRHWVALYMCSLCILVRNLVRVVEFAQGSNSLIAKFEAMIYIFDASLMFLTMFIPFVIHPGRLYRQLGLTESSWSELQDVAK